MVSLLYTIGTGRHIIHTLIRQLLVIWRIFNILHRSAYYSVRRQYVLATHCWAGPCNWFSYHPMLMSAKWTPFIQFLTPVICNNFVAAVAQVTFNMALPTVAPPPSPAPFSLDCPLPPPPLLAGPPSIISRPQAQLALFDSNIPLLSGMLRQCYTSI